MVENTFNVCIKLKSDKEAEEFREIGNTWFKKEVWYQALLNYNKSIVLAKSKAVASLSYANRGAVYLQIGRYKDCLENIQLAFDNDYPKNKYSTLLNRKEKCKELMLYEADHVVDPSDVFKLSYPANEKIPWLVNCVEVRTTEKYGRGIYATADLKAGDVICIEKLAFNYTGDKDIYIRCFNCAKANGMNLIPCDQTASMMFCSVDCKDDFNFKAFSKEKMKSADMKMLADLADAFGSVQNVDEYVQGTDLKDMNKTVFDFDWNNPEDPNYKKNLMTCLLSLSTNDRRFNGSRYIREYVSNKTAQHIQSIYYVNNKEGVCLFGHNVEGVDCRLIYGFDIPLFASLINHSCYMNAFATNLDNNVLTIINKPVKKGEQIFILYDDNKGVFERDTSKFMNIYKFKCDCELCTHQELMYQVLMTQLPQIKLDVKVTELAEDAARSKDPEKMRDIMQEVWQKINDDPTYPKIMYTIYWEARSFLKSITSFLTYQFI